jgi:hypothetical protein
MRKNLRNSFFSQEVYGESPPPAVSRYWIQVCKNGYVE